MKTQVTDNTVKTITYTKIRTTLLAVVFLVMLAVGCFFQGPTVSDEVVHYYMLVTQADKLPAPNVEAIIPMKDWSYSRYYPHVFLWHYVGSFLWLAFGQQFAVVQIYQLLFWAQLIWATYRLGGVLYRKKDLDCLQCESILLLSLLSMPMMILFGILLYQDVPAAAQIVTSFFMAATGHMWLSIIFMSLAVNIKVTAFVMLPAYLLFLGWTYLGTENKLITLARVVSASALLFISCVPMAVAINKLHWNYYPLEIAHKYYSIVKNININLPRASRYQAIQNNNSAPPAVQNSSVVPSVKNSSRTQPGEETLQKASHPGDLRKAQNWAIYFGGVWWLIILAAISAVPRLIAERKPDRIQVPVWPLLVGAWYIIGSMFEISKSPDARFLLPSIPFLLISLSAMAARLFSRKLIIMFLAFLAIVQGVSVLAVTAGLRSLPRPARELIKYAESKTNFTANCFMYPEGEERFLAGSVEWYMNNNLTNFWMENNDERIKRLYQLRVGWIIVRKDRISNSEDEIGRAGAYPESFVRQIEADKRFTNLYENNRYKVFSVPFAPGVAEAVEYMRGLVNTNDIILTQLNTIKPYVRCRSKWFDGPLGKQFLMAMDNDTRIFGLNRKKIRFIMLEKSRIQDVSGYFRESAVYPKKFTDDIAGDNRFNKLFENEEIIIYSVPSLSRAGNSNG